MTSSPITDPWAYSSFADGEPHQRRYQQLIPFLESYFGNRSIKVLEIGVYRAGLITALSSNSSLNIASYFGVDPYLGVGSDPYLGAYWKNSEGAEKIYQKSRKIFECCGGKLHRQTSSQFHDGLCSKESFDLIYIDGDHRFHAALSDLRMFFPQVNPDGLLGIDDYSNVDTPDVTLATNKFLTENSALIAGTAGVTSWFKNAGKILPVVQVSVFVKPSWRDDESRLAAASRLTKLVSQRRGRKNRIQRLLRPLTRVLRK